MANSGGYIAQGIGAFLLGALGGAAKARQQKQAQQADIAGKMLTMMVQSGSYDPTMPGLDKLAKLAGFDPKVLESLAKMNAPGLTSEAQTLLGTSPTTTKNIPIPGLSGGTPSSQAPAPVRTPSTPSLGVASREVQPARVESQTLGGTSVVSPTPSPTPTPIPQGFQSIPVSIPQRTYESTYDERGRVTGIKGVEPSPAQYEEAMGQFANELAQAYLIETGKFPNSSEIDAALQEIGRVNGVTVDFDTVNKVKEAIATRYLTSSGQEITPPVLNSVFAHFGAVPKTAGTLLGAPTPERIETEAAARGRGELASRREALPVLRQEQVIRTNEELRGRREAIREGLPEGEAYYGAKGSARGQQETGGGLPKEVVEAGAMRGMTPEQLFQNPERAQQIKKSLDEAAAMASKTEYDNTNVPFGDLHTMGIEELAGITWGGFRELREGPSGLELPDTSKGKSIASLRELDTAVEPLFRLAKQVNIYGGWDPRRIGTKLFSAMGTNKAGAALEAQKGILSIVMRNKYKEKGNISDKDIARSVKLFPFPGESRELTALKENLYRLSRTQADKVFAGTMTRDQYSSALDGYLAQVDAVVAGESPRITQRQSSSAPQSGSTSSEFAELFKQGLGE